MDNNGLFRVLYICAANFNRGPGAAYMTVEMAKRQGLPVLADSAGLINPPYQAMNPDMEGALRRRGYEPPIHLAKRVTRNVLLDQDLVLCMGRHQKDKLGQMVPELGRRDNLHTLTEYAGFPQDSIPDPHDGMMNLRYYPALRLLPTAMRLMVYRQLGMVDKRDDAGVQQLYDGLVKDLEACVKNVVQRIVAEQLQVRTAPVSSVSVLHSFPRLDPLLPGMPDLLHKTDIIRSFLDLRRCIHPCQDELDMVMILDQFKHVLDRHKPLVQCTIQFIKDHQVILP